MSQDIERRVTPVTISVIENVPPMPFVPQYELELGDGYALMTCPHGTPYMHIKDESRPEGIRQFVLPPSLLAVALQRLIDREKTNGPREEDHQSDG